MLNCSVVRLRLKTDARLVLVASVGDERELNCFFDERKMMNWMSRFVRNPAYACTCVDMRDLMLL